MFTPPFRTRFVTAAVLAIAACGLLLTRWPGGAASAEAAVQAATTPGQLTIVDKTGNPSTLCPLKHTDVTADIAGYVARVTVKQQFSNPSNTPVEAVYTFPLPQDAAVDDMTMVIGKRVVRGLIKRKEEARQIYEAAKAQGQAAALLDQERPNIFTQSVANIMPGENVTITISYVNLLKYQDGEYEFVYPMVVGPRFVPSGGYSEPGKRGAPSATPPGTIGGLTPEVSKQTRQQGGTSPDAVPIVTDAHKITPPITPPSTRAGHDISVTVNLDAGIPLQEVKSTLHAVNVRKFGTTRAVVRLQDQQTIPNKDLILHFRAAGSDVQEGVLTHVQGKNGYFTLIVQPPLAPAQDKISPKEMVFVIDQTGSQSGWPIAKAKETMRHCIQNLNPGDTFQLIGFNTQIFPCFDAPVPSTAENVQKALKFLEPIEGGGGTDILKAADYALKIPDDPDRLRIICYMTDGYVGNDMQIIDFIRKNRGRARMFPFGVGNSVNRFLIDGMAREGRGACEYVTLDTSGSGAVMGTSGNEPGSKDAKQAAQRFYNRIASPLLLDISVDWNGMPVDDVFPKQIPDLFSSGPVILKGRYTKPAEGDITIHGTLRGKPWSRTLHLVLPAVTDGGAAIPTLWARERIEDLQAQDWLGAQSGQPHADLKEQIINTALEYRLMSQYTSFVAVEDRIVNIGGKQKTIDVPVEMPDGVSYTGIFGGAKTESESLGRYRGAIPLYAGAAGKPLATANGQVSQYNFQANGLSAAGGSMPAGAGGFGGRMGGGMGGGMGGSGFGRGGQGGRYFGTNAPAVQPPAVPGIRATLAARPALAEELRQKATRTGSDKGKVYKDADGRAALSDRMDAVRERELFDTSALLTLEEDQFNKKLAKVKPADRKAIIEQRQGIQRETRLSPSVRKLIADWQAAKTPEQKHALENVEVQIWVDGLPKDGIARLKALGFTYASTLTPNRLLLGTIPLAKLDEIIKRPWVLYVDLPKYR